MSADKKRFRLVEEHAHVTKDGESLHPEEAIGRRGVWAIALRGRGVVTVLVKIVDARKVWDRLDLLVETNTGDRTWVSDKTVTLVPREKGA
jgi:hypothetical protein